MSVAVRCARGVAIALVALLVVACQTTTTTKPGSKVKRAKPSDPNAALTFFWEVEGSDGARFFLLGSVHLGDARGLALDPQIERDWNASQELVVQLDATALSEIDTIGATHRHGLLPEPTTLRQVVRADTVPAARRLHEAARLRHGPRRSDASVAGRASRDGTRVRRARPRFAERCRSPSCAAARRAPSRSGRSRSLEEEMALFGRMPDGLQETWLVESLREAPKFLDVSRAILAAWERGDDAEMERLLFGNTSGDPQVAQFYASIFQGRNPALADRLAALAADGKPRFVVIHTGHLIGSQGVPELLAQRGYRVVRIGSAQVMRDPATPVVTRARGTAAPAAAPPRPAASPPAAPPSAGATAPPAPAAVPVATTAAPASVPASALPPAPTAPTPPAGAPHEAWLGQDAAPAPQAVPLAPDPGAAPTPATTPESTPPAPAKPKRPRIQTKLGR